MDDFLQKAWINYDPKTEKPPKGAKLYEGPRHGHYYQSQLRGPGGKKGKSLLYGRKYGEGKLLETSFFEKARGDEATGYHTLSGLGIPRSWTHCLINSNPKAKIQVIGLDKYNRFQTIVDPKYIRRGVLNHFMTLKRMGGHQRGNGIADATKIIKRLQDNSLSGSVAQRNAATIFLMEAQHGFRIGSYSKTLGDVASFGTSTLLGKHITKTEARKDKKGKMHYWVTFSFPGKNGHMHDEKVDSHAFYQRVKTFKRDGGKANDRIFQDPFRDKMGNKVLRPVTWKSVHRYMDSLVNVKSPDRIKDLKNPLKDGEINKVTNKKENQRYTSHDFRRWFATEKARKEIKNYIARNGRPKTGAEFKALQKDISEKVSKKLRNSPQVALDHYILETVWYRLQTPGVKELKAQGKNAKKSMDGNGGDYWNSMSEMLENTHIAGIDDYEDEEENKEEETSSKSDEKGLEEIKEEIGKMLRIDAENLT